MQTGLSLGKVVGVQGSTTFWHTSPLSQQHDFISWRHVSSSERILLDWTVLVLQAMKKENAYDIQFVISPPWLIAKMARVYPVDQKNRLKALISSGITSSHTALYPMKYLRAQAWISMTRYEARPLNSTFSILVIETVNPPKLLVWHLLLAIYFIKLGFSTRMIQTDCGHYSGYGTLNHVE